MAAIVKSPLVDFAAGYVLAHVQHTELADVATKYRYGDYQFDMGQAFLTRVRVVSGDNYSKYDASVTNLA